MFSTLGGELSDDATELSATAPTITSIGTKSLLEYAPTFNATWQATTDMASDTHYAVVQLDKGSDSQMDDPLGAGP